MDTLRISIGAVGMALTLMLALPPLVWGHCDALDGPVVTDAKAALAKGEITPVLKWVQKENDGAIRAAFAQAAAVRDKGTEAKALAETYFFETLVRLHRQGEGAPFTGLKPAGGELDPAVAAADKALEATTASANRLCARVSGQLMCKALMRGNHVKRETFHFRRGYPHR